MRNNIKIYALLLLSFSFSVSAQQPIINIDSMQNTMYIGDTILLNWDIQHADYAYIFNLGKIPLSGSQKISPQENTTFTIIAEGENGIISKSIFINVEGGRGKKDFPSFEKFDSKRQFTIQGISTIKILKHIHNILQDYLEVQVNESYDRHNGKTIFLTKLTQNPNLIQSDESQIRSRRIAYMVEVKNVDSKLEEYSYSVDVYIQYQRRSESTWRTEQDKKIYTKKIMELHELIDKISN